MYRLTNDKTADELIAGYFTQELNTDELSVLRNWINASTENKAFFEIGRASCRERV